MSRPQLAIELRTTSSRVAEALRAELLDGAYAPGTPLREGDLSTRTGVSRPTVREALAELARDGLVVHSLHRGVEVARLEPADVHDLYATRRVIEQAGVAALTRARVRDVDALGEALDAMATAARAGDRRAVVAADAAFHAALARAAGVRRLERAHAGAMLELRLVLSVTDRVHADVAAQLVSHERLRDMLSGNSPREAARELERHLDAAERNVCAIVSAPTA
jgi:DNA-binding GntR family transcriptional regulator